MSATLSRPSALQSLLLLGALAGMLGSLYIALQAGLSDAKGMRARWQIGQWQLSAKMRPKPVEIGRARNELLAALEWQPDDPQMLEQLGYLYSIRSQFAQGLPELEHAMLEEAALFYRQAAARRPMSPYPWANIAFGLHRRNVDPAAMWEAFDRALQYGRREGPVQIRLLQVGLARWDEAGESRRAMLLGIIADARGRARKEILRMLEVGGRADLIPEAD